MSDNIVIEKLDISKSYNGLNKFDCEHEIINRFVRKSMKSQVRNSYSTAYVLLDLELEERLIGFYTITTFSIKKSAFNSPLKSSPSSVPVFRMAMLGVDKSYTKKGYGSKLLMHCFKLVARVSKDIGAKGLYIDAEDKKHDWYAKFGFVGIAEADEQTNILPMFIATDTILNGMI